MLFNSYEFLTFFTVAVFVYYAVPHRIRWMVLLAGSYYFYACWKLEYLSLILLSTLIDYGAAIAIAASNRSQRRKALLLLSLASNLGILFFFKYANFFSSSLQAAFGSFNIFVDVPVYTYLLPVGISFYTFQSMSYTIDVYRGSREPERHLGLFALYVAFFPQLVAGPIERSTHLLPQFGQKVSFNSDQVQAGLRLMLLGYFKKLVIADNLAVYVDAVFNTPDQVVGWPILIAGYFFGLQIYCDFSAYTDIARGAAKIMGFDLMENFRAPYLSKSVKEFWGRWHISLSTWFRDYVYLPLGGNRVGPLRWTGNILLVFVLSGLWHGANWTFVCWGLVHGIWMNVERGLKRVSLFRVPWVGWLVTFHVVTFSWFFFRAGNMGEFVTLMRHLVDIEPHNVWRVNHLIQPLQFIVAGLAAIWVVLYDCIRVDLFGLRQLQLPLPVRWVAMQVAIVLIMFLGAGDRSAFIYFQF